MRSKGMSKIGRFDSGDSVGSLSESMHVAERAIKQLEEAGSGAVATLLAGQLQYYLQQIAADARQFVDRSEKIATLAFAARQRPAETIQDCKVEIYRVKPGGERRVCVKLTANVQNARFALFDDPTMGLESVCRWHGDINFEGARWAVWGYGGRSKPPTHWSNSGSVV
jgi:hypothetical protein